MSAEAFDPEILQDFLTESGELLEQVEADLVVLEERPNDLELLNQIFRALHTIKGSASFLAFTELVEIAHAAESALNAARNGQITVTSREMDLMLEAIDVIKVQFNEISTDGGCSSSAERSLVESLTIIGEGKALGDEGDPSTDAESEQSPTNDNEKPLELGEHKLDLLEPLTADVDESLSKIQDEIHRLSESDTRSAASATLRDQAEELVKTIEFFEIPETLDLVNPLAAAFEKIETLEEQTLFSLLPRLEALCLLLVVQNARLRDRFLITWETGTFLERIAALAEGELSDDIALEEGCEPEEALRFDGVDFGDAGDDDEIQATPGSAAQNGAPSEAPTKTKAVSQVEQSIRVDVDRLEELMNLVGELVLQKNRVIGLSDEFERIELDSNLQEQMEMTAGVLDRITGDIQLAVMRTRMQPLNKLLGKYPRLIRDLAAKTGKQIALVIEGGETEVDKSVIEELGDPLVHLLRNSADHGVEPPEERTAAGKGPKGTITIRAGHSGSHVSVQVIDDGRGLRRDKIGAKAIEQGIVTPDQLEHMSDDEVFRLILQAGFSTAEQVSDISGRGVGMDVVRTNIESKLNGQLSIESAPGKGTTLTITIPLTLAIMPAMMVGVREEVYAIPLGNIEEIVRPTPESITSVGGYPVIHLRGSVIPLISAREILGAKGEKPQDEGFVVLVNHSSKTIGLRVNRVIGQQEIVMKPLDGLEREGPISGATIRNDGSVSLIVDIAKLMHAAASATQTVSAHENAAAAGVGA